MTNAIEFCEKVSLSDAARALLDPELPPRDYFHMLLETDLHADAIMLLPHLLPKRVAVWWGCLCAWDAVRPNPPEKVHAALQAALRWVLDPSEENRRAAEQPAQAAEFDTSAGCLAMAVFWSGGSMTRPDLPVVPPPPHLTARLVGGAVLLAAVEREPMLFRETYRRYLALGMQVARGENLWYELPVEVAQPVILVAAETNGQLFSQPLVASGW